LYVFLKLFFYFSNFLYSTGGSRKRLRPGVIYLLLSISTGLGALIYASINALKKLTHCVNALKKINALTALLISKHWASRSNTTNKIKWRRL